LGEIMAATATLKTPGSAPRLSGSFTDIVLEKSMRL
jgi:hypothetical protein